jgi:thermitase
VPVSSLLRRGAVVVALLVALVAGVVPAAGAPDDPSPMIVSFADGAARARLLQRFVGGASMVGPTAAAGDLRAADVQALRAQPGVVHVEPDAVFHAMRTVNDPCITSTCAGAQEWAIPKINAAQAWDYSLGTGVTIAILDAGVNGTHPDLVGKPVRAEIDDTDGATADGDHGTSVAGVAAANTNNGVGIAGLGWDSRILAIKVLDNSGSGLASWVARGIRDATDLGAKVINLSLGGDTDSLAVRQAVDYATGAGAVVVASMGNAGTTSPVYPAAIDSVIGVGASTEGDSLAGFSNRGTGLDISAPGQNLPAPIPPNGYDNVAGTSFSAPIVSGIAALLLAQGIEPAGSIAARLQETGVPLNGGNGRRVDAGAALAITRAYGLFSGGTRIALGDLTGDTGTEIVTGAGPGGGPHVRVLNASYADRGGFFAYDKGFSGGVDVAAGNLDGSGPAEIVTAPGAGGGPHVRTFTASGAPISGFMAYPGFFGGVSVTTGDIDGDGTAEIITGPGPGGGPHVKIFRADGTQIGGGFMAYAQSFHGGVDVAATDLDGDGKAEIITGAGAGGGPHVRIFRADGTPVGGFMAYAQSFTGGVRVGAYANRIVTGPGRGGGPHVRLFNANGGLVAERLGFPSYYTGGVDVAVGPAGPLVANLSGDTLVRTLLNY